MAKRAPKKLFNKFGKYFPYSTVDIVIKKNDTFLLTKRNISPYKGKWHLPGGIIHRGERMHNAAKVIIKNELNVEIKIKKFLGIYENLVSERHDISHAFEASILSGNIQNDFQSSDVKFFKRLPKNIIPFHRTIIIDMRKSLNK
ncbi:GDP-mannose mannosyl hydrolase [Nitrosotalea devaniterrae]|uniref:GDP-mannose mannosyl hydrolase n=1 Tax=Nitrosotalea devaniterrae TaxID=1078905 RepID=A0A128A0M0_9ARCH|nr:GDP-mannose mannosyl hydrolase [Candidatus Nitrosotalea devanaterra]